MPIGSRRVGGALCRGRLARRDDKVRRVLQSDIGELTIIPFGKSKESVIKMFAEEVMAKL